LMITNSHGEDYRILGKVAKSDDFFLSGRVRIVAKMSTGLMSYYMKLCSQILSGQVDDVSKSWKVQPWHVQFYRNFVPTFRVSLCFIVARFMNFCLIPTVMKCWREHLHLRVEANSSRCSFW
jgi:hypothetical protein